MNPSRYSSWNVSLPFALNSDYYSIPAESHFFTTPVTEAVPILSQFNTDGADPSGSRHLKTHPSFIRILASGRGYASVNFEKLDFNAADISPGSGVSKTKVFLFRICRITSPGISRVHHMKVWASDLSDFLVPYASRILYKTSTPWLSGFRFLIEDMPNKDYWMENSLPEQQNLFKTGGATAILGSGDADVSQWVYCALAASGIAPLGEYGGRLVDGHPSGFQIRVTYNISNVTFII